MISTKTICSRVEEALSKGGYTVNVRLLKRTRNKKEVIYVAVECADGFSKFFELEPFDKVQEAQNYIVSQFMSEYKDFSSNLNPELILKHLYPVLSCEKDLEKFQGAWNNFRVEFCYNIDGTLNTLGETCKRTLKLSSEELITIALNNAINNLKIYNHKSLLEKAVGRDLAELVADKNLGLNNQDVCFLYSDFCEDISGILLIPDVFKFISKEKASDLMVFRLENNFLIIIPVKALETGFGNRKTVKFKNHIKALNEIINKQHAKKEPLSNVFIYRRKLNTVDIF